MSEHSLPANHDVLGDTVDLSGRRVIDVGSGAGGMVRWMCKQGAEAVGVECGPVMQQLAWDADPDNHDRYFDAVGQDLPFDDDSADVVTMFYSLHHVPADEMLTALAEARRVLRDGGVLYVAEPVPAGPGFDAMVLVDDETHVRGLAQSALDRADEAGLTEQERIEYRTSNWYPDFAAFEKNVVGIDPARATAMEQNRQATQELFVQHGTPKDDGFLFEQPVVVRTFS